MATRALPALGSDGARAAALPPVLALDVGGTKLAAGVVDAAGTTHSFLAEPTLPERGPADTVQRLLDLGRRAVAESGIGWAEIAAVGIGCGGPLDVATGTVLAPPHLPGWRELPLAALVEEEYDRPAALENDATAAAAAEHAWGAGAGTRHMVYLTLSTGVGGGVVADGRLYRGARGNGAELGHVTVEGGTRGCRGCGRRGCLEAYVSGTSIAERAREALAADGAGSSLSALGEPTAADVVAAARAGDPLASAVWRETVDAFGSGLTSIVNVFEPELVVVGGGVSSAGDALLAPARDYVRARAIVPGAAALDVVPAALGERVGVVGAAAVVLDRIGSGAVATRG
ncbi:MAG TPA: ROK family protein [Gaiellaceae bacterium]|nr:ROK family protein [Gaiellaceae bacterium]